MSFQGSLAELPLPDIIQLVSVSGRTGRFDLSSNDGSSGQIFLRDGRIVHATTMALEGEDAVYELAIWPEGDFVFTPDREPRAVTIRKSNTNLLMEAARRIDEWRHLSGTISSTDHIPHFSHYDGPVSLTAAEWRVVRQINGQRTVAELADVLGWSVFDICKLLHGLVTAELVVLYEPEESIALIG